MKNLHVIGLIIAFGLGHSRAEDFSSTNRESLQHFWQAAEEKLRPVTVVSFGDSMADSYRSPTFYLMLKLGARLGEVGYSLNNYRNRIMYQLTNCAVVGPNTNWFCEHISVPPGGILWWKNQMSDGGIRCDEAGIFYIRQPQGGFFTLSVSTNTGPWSQQLVLDGYSATPVGCFTNLNLPLNQYRLRVDGVSGTNLVIGTHVVNRHTHGLHVAFMDWPGIHLGQVTNVPLAIRSPIFAALKPDLLIWHMKEDGSLSSSNRMEECENWWSTAAPDCDVLYIGTPYVYLDATNSPTPVTRDQNRLVRAIAVQHNRAYVDLMQPAVSYEDMVTNGLIATYPPDGVHPTYIGGQWGANIMWNDMNLFALTLPRTLSLQRTGGLARVTFPTAAGAVYHLQSSPNLKDWTPVTTMTGNGNTLVTNLNAGGTQEFYRLNLTPN